MENIAQLKIILAVSEWLGDTAESLVDDEKAVRVVGVVEPDNCGVSFRMFVAKADVGKIIGKSGRTARSIRTLLGARAKKDGTIYSLDIVEDDRP
jgi:predicted RNA-binding protein YlqC (UPF0109 family)